MRTLVKWAKKGGTAKNKKKVELEEEQVEDPDDAEAQADDQGDGQDQRNQEENASGNHENNEEMTPMEGGSIVDLKDIEYTDMDDNKKLYRREMSRLKSIRKRRSQLVNKKELEGGD